MKKKLLSPLTLNRETLRQLQTEQLSHRVAGGNVVISDFVVNGGNYCGGPPKSKTQPC